MQPYVVESLLDEDSLTVYNHKPKVVRRVISEETSKTVCSILEQVVGDRTRARDEMRPLPDIVSAADRHLGKGEL